MLTTQWLLETGSQERESPEWHAGWVERSAYVRFSVWKIREICSMTGPVSESFIH